MDRKEVIKGVIDDYSSTFIAIGLVSHFEEYFEALDNDEIHLLISAGIKELEILRDKWTEKES